ncbi:50S ribosomal protein L25 [Vulcanimicrobium alpinum]|uniref:Large ribosomal subunit protein bL25 n=1 Tax=Vulcanimicrobium alpinum TaxID=3016050 RepID=A0AAN1XYP4_UNVUL|nr:50S ribosomal protein L25 [Vulcanimicrobium alpinum]BDE07832.1 50S ribosomal protein L25 [Vulcanimicrobium alpinum]
MAKPHAVALLNLEARTEVGTTGAQHARRAGKVPGVVYGHGSATPIAIDAKELADLILSGSKSHIVQASVAGKTDSVLLRRIETDPISRKPLSVDFQRVTKGETIFATVNVVTEGTPIGVKDQGGVMDVITHCLELKGPADRIPDVLTVDVSALNVHEHITAAQVPLPKGFTLVTPPETNVVAVEITRAAVGAEEEAAPAAAAPAAEAAEPAAE